MYNLSEAHFNILKTSVICRPYKNLIAVTQYLPPLLTCRYTLSVFSVSSPICFKTLKHHCLHNTLMRKDGVFFKMQRHLWLHMKDVKDSSNNTWCVKTNSLSEVQRDLSFQDIGASGLYFCLQ